MQVVILAGGYGTRIRDVREDIPKPLIPIGSRPIIHHIMEHFAGFGFKDFIICTGYMGDKLKQYFLNFNQFDSDITIDFSNNGAVSFHNRNPDLDWQVTLVNTGLDTMTGARIKKIEPLIYSENFFITYGDGVGDVELEILKNYHLEHAKTLTVTGVRPPGRFGELQHKDGTVLGFNEKPHVTEGRISGGFFAAKKTIFKYLNDEEDLIFEEQPMQELVATGELMMHKHNGFWHPMDTYRDYKYLNNLYNEGNLPWCINGEK